MFFVDPDTHGLIPFVNLDDPSMVLDAATLTEVRTPAGVGGPVELAISGRVFSEFRKNATDVMLRRLLLKCNIYARMSPTEKLQLVESLQKLDFCVGMVGDGANDCGALRMADVGISLSEEASIAAPFTSKEANIGCAPRVVREGRAALVTSFSCFKYMALYSLVQFTTICLLYYYDQTLGNFQFMYFDLLTVLPLAIFRKSSSLLARFSFGLGLIVP